MINDDGKGINRDAILEKAMTKGIVGSEAADWPDEKINNLIFAPVFPHRRNHRRLRPRRGHGCGQTQHENLEPRRRHRRIGQGRTIRLLPLAAIINGLVVASAAVA